MWPEINLFLKMKANETIEIYKTKLVKGFKQQNVTDYFDTYSVVSIIIFIWMLIVITFIEKLEIH